MILKFIINKIKNSIFLKNFKKISDKYFIMFILCCFNIVINNFMSSGSNFNIITGEILTYQDSRRFKSVEQLVKLST